MLKVLSKINIVTEYIPNNMTKYYQPLDYTTNKWAKEFMKNKFSTGYTKEVQSELKKDTSIEDNDIKFPLTI